MSAPRDPDLVLAAWLDDGPVDLPSSTRRAISTAVRTTPQARAGFGLPAWRPTMSRFVTLAGAAAVVAVGIGLFAVAVPRNSGGIGGPPVATATPSPSPTPSPTSTPAPSISTVGWQTFPSTRYGYTLGVPTTWVPTPASRAWRYEVDRTDVLSPASDHFDGYVNGESLLLTAFSLAVPSGTVLQDWIASYMTAWGSCTVPTPSPLVIDGHPGFIVDTACEDAEAFTLVNDRVYVFSTWRRSGRPFLEAVASTIKIDGVRPTASPTEPAVAATPNPS